MMSLLLADAAAPVGMMLGGFACAVVLFVTGVAGFAYWLFKRVGRRPQTADEEDIHP